MSEGDTKNRGVVVDHQHHPPSQPPQNGGVVVDHQHHAPPQPPQYGTFQGVANYPPPPPPHQHVIGFPQPVAPPGVHSSSSSASPPYYGGYQTVPGYAVAEGRPVTVRERRLPCCGLGLGWVLFILGFFFGTIPWYLGLFVLLCARVDPREKTGYVACTIAALIATVAIVFGATKGTQVW